jgi:hypothetical protein
MLYGAYASPRNLISIVLRISRRNKKPKKNICIKTKTFSIVRPSVEETLMEATNKILNNCLS